MPEYSWKAFQKSAQARPGSLQECSVWLLAGEEGWLRREFQQRLLADLLSEEERAWGLEIFGLTPALARTQPAEGSWAQNILRAAATLPFFSAKRVVLVEEVHLLPASQQEELASAFGRISESSVLIFSSSESAGQKRSRLSGGFREAAKKEGNLVLFDPLREAEAIAWAEEEARKAGKRLERSAASLLVHQRLGTDLGSLKREIEKLVLFAEALPSIRCEQVEEMTPRRLEESVFELTDTVSQGKAGRARALTLARRLLKAKEEPARILGALSRHFRLLWQTKALLERGWKPGDSVKDLEGAEQILLSRRDSVSAVFARQAWLARKYVEQARRFSWSQLEEAFPALSRCDLALKGLAFPPCTDPGLALELALISLCGDSRETPSSRH